MFKWMNLSKCLLVLSLSLSSLHAAIVADAGAFPDNTDLTNAFPGVTLSLVDSPDPNFYVSNYNHPNGFGYFGIGTGPWADLRWQKTDGSPVDDSRGLFRADFASATDFVSLETGSTGAPDVFSVMEAYDVNDNLLDTFVTGLHNPTFGINVTMSIARATSDIAYIIAYGDSANPLHDGVTLLNLEFNEGAGGGGSGGGGGAAPVPEPSTYALLALGLLACASRTRLMRKK